MKCKYKMRGWVMGFALLLSALLGFGQTVNLTSHQPASASIPTGATLEWHYALPISSSNLMTAAQIAAAGPGVYYSVYNYGNGCYSQPTPLSIAGICGTSITNLHKYVDSSLMPASNVVSFHTGMPATAANQMTNAAANAAAPGTYYSAYMDMGTGCYSGQSVIVVLTACPDFTPIITPEGSLNLKNTGDKTGVILTIAELLDNPSVAQVVVRIRKLSAFDILFDANMTTTAAGNAVDNTSWLFTQDNNFIYCTLKPGLTIQGFGLSNIGFTIVRKANVNANTSQNLSAFIVINSGGDSVPSNNTANTVITAN